MLVSLCALVACGNTSKPKHSHKYIEVDEVASTCVTPGTKAHYKCEGCDKLFVNEDSTKWTETHRFASTEKDEYIVKNGVSEYKILVPELTTFTTFARDELIRFFYEATGVTLAVETNPVSHGAGGKYISTPRLSERADLP